MLGIIYASLQIILFKPTMLVIKFFEYFFYYT